MNTIMSESYILIKPSSKMCEYIKQMKTTEKIPVRIEAIASNKKLKDANMNSSIDFVTTEKDFTFITSLDNKLKDENIFTQLFSCEINTFSPKDKQDGFLQLGDLLWLNTELEKERKTGNYIYLHELLKDCLIYVPENEKIERNLELEKRCTFLKTQQDNLRYKCMTKNVDNVRLREPEESIAYQLKQINKQLIAVGQFIISVIAGFAFGFIGVELLIGNLDFGFRLLLGIMCALTIALAELYFLAKQLVD